MLRNRKGVTLFEVMTVLGLAAILLAMAVPQMSNSRRAAHMASARTQVEAYLGTARAIAIRNGGKTQLVRSGNTLTIEADTGAGYVTMLKPLKVGAGTDVGLNVTATTIAFDARGLATGLNATGEKFYLTVSSGYGAGLKDSVCISRLGALLDRNCGSAAP
jgi:prepilin-type N-terminal cleavage/methylation domain-containing protein